MSEISWPQDTFFRLPLYFRILRTAPSARSEGLCFLSAYFMQADRTLAHLPQGDRTSIADCVHVAGSQTVCAPIQLRWSTEGSGCSAIPPHDLDFLSRPMNGALHAGLRGLPIQATCAESFCSTLCVSNDVGSADVGHLALTDGLGQAAGGFGLVLCFRSH